MKSGWIGIVAIVAFGSTSASATMFRNGCQTMQRLAQQHSNDMARRDHLDHAGLRAEQEEALERRMLLTATIVRRGQSPSGHARHVTPQICAYRAARGLLRRYRDPAAVFGRWKLGSRNGKVPLPITNSSSLPSASLPTAPCRVSCARCFTSKCMVRCSNGGE